MNKAYELITENLSFMYDRKNPILQELSFSIKPGETVGIIGANGAGKSTLLKLLVGLLSDYTGKILIDKIVVEKKTLKEIRAKVGYIFQDSDSQLFLSTVYEDVAFGPRNYGFSKEETDKKVMNALEKVHMEKLRDRQVYKLSGGQKKLAAIASVLSMEPGVILLDEPSVALDPRNRRNLMKVLNDMSCTKLIASHDLNFVKGTCQRVIFLCEGKIVAEGDCEEILSNRKLLEKYGL